MRQAEAGERLVWYRRQEGEVLATCLPRGSAWYYMVRVVPGAYARVELLYKGERDAYPGTLDMVQMTTQDGVELVRVFTRMLEAAGDHHRAVRAGGR